MKRFSVPIKKSLDDFTCTRDLWLTMNVNQGDFRLAKKDNATELLLGIGGLAESVSIFHQQSDQLEGVFRKLIIVKDKALFCYVNPEKSMLKTANTIDITAVLFKRRAGSFAVIEKGVREYKLDKGDVIICFDSALSAENIKKTAAVIQASSEISFLLMGQILDFSESGSKKFAPVFLIDIAPCMSYSFPIKSSLKSVAMTVDMFKNKILKYNNEKIWQIETVLHEALVNSITYGNEMDPEKNLSIEYEIGDKGMRVIIKDLGDGFDVNNISVPVGDEALERISGRGIYIMHKFSNAMFYNEKGNELMLFFDF